MSYDAPTLRTLAQAAGVSVTTVSLALRNRPNVGSETRKRIQQLAREMGYRPDPEVAKLMSHLGQRRPDRFRGSICALASSVWSEPGHPYWSQLLVTGARKRAIELGFSWETLPLEELQKRPKAMSRVLSTRGVEGILLPPAVSNCVLPDENVWDLFSVVAASHSILAPDFRRVVPNHYQNIWTICRELNALGCRRMGFQTSVSQDVRTQHQHSAGLTAFQRTNGLSIIPPLVISKYSPEAIQAWVQEENLDAIIVESPYAAERISQDLAMPIPGPVAIACTTCLSTGQWAGIDDLPGFVGASAIDQLSGMIQRRETGIPEHQSVTTIAGVWRGGSSAQRTRQELTRKFNKSTASLQAE